MTSYSGQDFVQLILFVLGIIWMFKIAFHFSYLRSTGSIKESNIVSFIVKPANFLSGFLIVSPFFFLNKGNGGKEVRGEKRLMFSTYVLWLAFVVSFYYLYKYPPTAEMREVKYDLTK